MGSERKNQAPLAGTPTPVAVRSPKNYSKVTVCSIGSEIDFNQSKVSIIDQSAAKHHEGKCDELYESARAMSLDTGGRS